MYQWFRMAVKPFYDNNGQNDYNVQDYWSLIWDLLQVKVINDSK